MAINKLLFIPQWHISATISSPESNYKSLYPKSNDPHWYFVNSDGSEKRIETGLDFRNGITTTTLATSSVLRARLDIALGLGLTFSGNFAGSSVSVFGVRTDMLHAINTATSGYVLTSNGTTFNWVTPSSLFTGPAGVTGVDNGLSIVSDIVVLGGTFTEATTVLYGDSNNIQMNSFNQFWIQDASDIFISSASGSFFGLYDNVGVGEFYAKSDKIDLYINEEPIAFPSSPASSTYINLSDGNPGGTIQLRAFGTAGTVNILSDNTDIQGGLVTDFTKSYIRLNDSAIRLGWDGSIFGTNNSLYIDSSLVSLTYNNTTFLTADSGTVSLIGAGTKLEINNLTGNALITSMNLEGLKYVTDYSGNFVTYSLVDKNYVDTELLNFLPLSGGTLSGNLEINGTTSNTLTLYSSGTGSTIFRVQGRSGELFSVVDGLTGSLFSVNNISGLPIIEVFSDDTILMGDYVAPSLNSTVKVTTVTGSNTIYSIDKSLYTGAFFEYTVTKGTNARAGSIMSVWNGLTSSYTETSTTDIGLTTDITFLVSSTGSNAILTASSSSNNWVIKTIIRSI
jgi:hypothetical protein